VILGELVQRFVAVQVCPAVADVQDAHLPPEVERHRHGRAHPAQCRIGLRFFHDLDVGLPKRRLELREHALGAGAVGFEKPFEGVEHELLDRHDDQGASALAGLVAAHAVGDETREPVLRHAGASAPAGWSARPASLY
jgi:hypothetical protein